MRALRFIVDDQNPLNQKLLRLIVLQRDEKAMYSETFYNSSMQMDSFGSGSEEEETKSPKYSFI